MRQAINDEFDKLKQQSDAVNDAATEQKKQDDAIKLIDEILDKGNPFKNINTGDIWIEDGLFDNNDKEAIKNNSKDIIDTTNEITTLDNDYPIETIVINEDIDIPSDDGVAINSGLPKKVKIILSNANKVRLAADKIKNKYKKQKPISTLRAKNKKGADWLKRAGCVDTDDLQTIDYNNDTNVTDLDDVETINYNNDTSVSDLIDLKKTSRKQLTAKKIIKKYRHLARKKSYKRPPPRTETDFDDLETIDYNNDTNISVLNDIASSSKKNRNTKKAAKKILQKYKKIAQKKTPLSFNLTDMADTETVDYNNDTNINDVLSSKSAEIAAKKISDKYRKIRKRKRINVPDNLINSS